LAKVAIVAAEKSSRATVFALHVFDATHYRKTTASPKVQIAASEVDAPTDSAFVRGRPKETARPDAWIRSGPFSIEAKVEARLSVASEFAAGSISATFAFQSRMAAAVQSQRSQNKDRSRPGLALILA
jgi:hypothetical protein